MSPPSTRRRILLALAAAALFVLAGAGAWQAARPAEPTGAHERAVDVERTLRCPTCQGLSVADSPSPIAAGMRQQVERQLAAGASPDQVRGYFIDRYGDWILLDPPRRGIGWLVWLLPSAALLAGILLVRRTLRRRPGTGQPAAAEPSAEELRAADELAARVTTSAELLAEPVAAAVIDLRAARLDAEVDPAAEGGLADARARLATALREYPTTGSSAEALGPGPDLPPEPDADADVGPAGERAQDSMSHRRRPGLRYALPVAALLFAGLLGLTLNGAIGERPSGGVVTGNFATGAPSMAPSGASSPELAALQRATHDRPDDPAAWLAYATALDQAGDLAEAETAYRNALRLDPTNPAATEQYGWLLTRGGSPKEALTLLTPLAIQRPDDPQVVLLLGLAQRGAGDPSATETLRRYLTLAPDSPQAAVVRGLLGQTP